MPCYHPISAWQVAPGVQPVFKQVPGVPKMYLPCGRCIGCRLERSRQWAMRCLHEASLYDDNCFITLTFSQEHLPPNGSLVKDDFQRFMKRLRRRFFGVSPVIVDGEVTYPIRYFMCGEYGSQLDRPHFHACIFNYDFPDRELWSERDGVRLYRSKILESLWPFGHSTVGDVTFESAAYVARYIMKKVVGDGSTEHYSRMNNETGEIYTFQPEYCDMSRRPGIARAWYEKFSSDLEKDFLTVRGKKVMPAKYYDRLLHHSDPEVYLERKLARKSKALANANLSCKDRHNDLKRLRIREKIKLNRVSSLERGFENATSNLFDL